MDGTAASRAEAGGSSLGILLPLRLLALLAAWGAGGPAFDRRPAPAANANPGLLPHLLALLAGGAGGPPPHLWIGAAIRFPGSLAGGVAGAVASAALLEARLAGRLASCRRGSSAAKAQAKFAARIRLPALTLPCGRTRSGRISPQLSCRAQPGVARPTCLVALLGARIAQRASRRGCGFATLGTQPLRLPFGSPAREPLAILAAALFGVTIGHDDLHRCRNGNG